MVNKDKYFSVESLQYSVATDQRIEQAIAQLENMGDLTLKAIALIAKVSLSRVSKSEAWKSYHKRVSAWFVDFPNAINNIATRKNYKPPLNREPKPVTTLDLSSIPLVVESASNNSTPTPQPSQNEEALANEPPASTTSTNAESETWGVGLLLPGSIVQCFGRAGCWSIKYCTGIVAKIVNWYGDKEIVSCEYLRLHPHAHNPPS